MAHAPEPGIEFMEPVSGACVIGFRPPQRSLNRTVELSYVNVVHVQSAY